MEEDAKPSFIPIKDRAHTVLSGIWTFVRVVYFLGFCFFALQIGCIQALFWPIHIATDFPTVEQVDTLEEWLDRYERVEDGNWEQRPGMGKVDNTEAIVKEFVEWLNKAGMESVHTFPAMGGEGLPKDKKEWRIDRMVWAEGGDLFMENPSTLMRVPEQNFIRVWEEGIEAARNDKDMPANEKWMYDFALMYFDRLIIVSSEIRWDKNMTLEKNRKVILLKYGD